MPQLLLHLLGDYILQSDWMALNKSKRSWPCLVHVILYTMPFLLLTHSWRALLLIGGSHFLIDRFGLVRYLIWLKNHLGPCIDIEMNPKEPDHLSWDWKRPYPPWIVCSRTGYFDERTQADFTAKVQIKLGDQEALHVSPGFSDDFARKEKLAREYYKACEEHGGARPLLVTVWLMIITDNALHLFFNFAALRWL